MAIGARLGPTVHGGPSRGRRAPRLLLLVSLWGAVWQGACSGGDGQAAVVVRAFVEGLQRSGEGSAGARQAYEALCPAERRALQRRARQASGLTGRQFAPWELWVPGRARFPTGLRWPRAALRMAPSGEAFVEVPAAGAPLRLRVERAEGRWCVRWPSVLGDADSS